MNENNKTVLVTGGSGYVAGWTIVALLKEGYIVRTTVRTPKLEKKVRASISRLVDPENRLTFFTADLLNDAGWDHAVEGCDFVLHVASPMGTSKSKLEDLLPPSKEGTLRVLKAAVNAKVKRVVMTSSLAAAIPETSETVSTEEVWTDLSSKNTPVYYHAKTLSEKAAWEFMENHQGVTTLTTILPALMLGPVLRHDFSNSVGVVARMLSGKIPKLPRIGFNIVDVRDVVDLHLKAMTSAKAAGQRLIAANDFIWLEDVAGTLKEQLGVRASKVSLKRAPNVVVKFKSIFNAQARLVKPRLGLKQEFSSVKASKLLGWKTRPLAQTLVDCGESLLREGQIE